MRKYFILILALGIFINTTAQKRWKIKRALRTMEEELKDHTGFALYDLEKDKMLFEFQANRYFTPASNTKIFTMYTSMKVIGDAIPGLYYRELGDSLIFWGTGDPSFLYENVVEDFTVYNFLRSTDKDLYFSAENFNEMHFGPNWSWDDYLYSYQVERTPMPVYGNYFKVSKLKGKITLGIDLPVFKKYFWLQDSVDSPSPVIREYGSNLTDYFPRDLNEDFERRVPFRYTPYLLTELLSDTLGKDVEWVEIPIGNYNTLYSVPADSLYKVLMQESDNFIAEQLLLTCAGVLTDTLQSSIAIKYAKDSLLKDLPDEPLWYDGSGLSRFNQFTPGSIVRLWKKMYKLYGEKRLLPLLAIGGEKGTLKNYYKADSPYVFGKTGTLRNNHSLSGFVKTDKGNLLIFSFMNSHFPGSSNESKVHMEKILQLIKTKF